MDCFTAFAMTSAQQGWKPSLRGTKQSTALYHDYSFCTLVWIASLTSTSLSNLFAMTGERTFDTIPRIKIHNLK